MSYLIQTKQCLPPYEKLDEFLMNKQKKHQKSAPTAILVTLYHL